MAIVDLTWDEVGERSIKRKRADCSALTSIDVDDGDETDVGDEVQEAVGARLQRRLRTLIQDMNREVRRLVKTVDECPNTKRDIKETVAAVRSLMSQLTTNEMNELYGTRPLHNRKGLASTEVRGTQTDISGDEVKPTTKEMETQTEVVRESIEVQIKETIKEEQISDAHTYADYKRVKEYIWPEEIYKRTKREDVFSPKMAKGRDILIWDEGDKKGEQTKTWLERYPDLKEMTGKITHIYVTMRKVDSQGESVVDEQVITRVETDGTEKDCYGGLTRAADFMVKNGRKAILMYPPIEESNGTAFRKMVECVFADTEVDCTIIYGRVDKRIAKRARERNSGDAVIVKRSEGETYADMLRKIKEGLNEKTEATDNIKNIRKTRDGNMVIAMKTNERQGTGEVQKIITKIDKNMKVRISSARGRGEIYPYM